VGRPAPDVPTPAVPEKGVRGTRRVFWGGAGRTRTGGDGRQAWDRPARPINKKKQVSVGSRVWAARAAQGPAAPGIRPPRLINEFIFKFPVFLLCHPSRVAGNSLTGCRKRRADSKKKTVTFPGEFRPGERWNAMREEGKKNTNLRTKKTGGVLWQFSRGGKNKGKFLKAAGPVDFDTEGNTKAHGKPELTAFRGLAPLGSSPPPPIVANGRNRKADRAETVLVVREGGGGGDTVPKQRSHTAGKCQSPRGRKTDAGGRPRRAVSVRPSTVLRVSVQREKKKSVGFSFSWGGGSGSNNTFAKPKIKRNDTESSRRENFQG